MRPSVQGRLVVRKLSHGQPQRALPRRTSHVVRRRRRVALVDRLSVLAEEDRDEDQTRPVHIAVI